VLNDYSSALPDRGIPEGEDQTSLLAFDRLVDRVNKDTLSLPPSANPDPDPPGQVVHWYRGDGTVHRDPVLLRAYYRLESG
jgi:hypothetical protein